MPLKLKSEVVSNILKILLIILVVLSALDLLFTLIYASDPNNFANSAYYPPYGFVSIMTAVLYYIIIVIYLIWIYRVHMDINLRYPQFYRTPGKALACMLIPFYNLYGIPSIYTQIGGLYQEQTEDMSKAGRWIYGLAVPMLILMMVSNGLSRLIARSSEDASVGLLVTASIMGLVLYGVYLTMTILVSRGLKVGNVDVVDELQV